MTNPVKALADAARRARVVLHNMTLEREGKLRMFSRWQISDEPLRNDAMHVVPDLDEAIAAYDAAHTCGECEGSGVVRAVGPTGEFADQWQEPCPKCDAAQAQPAPTDAEIEAAATVCVEAIDAVLPDEPLDELSNIFTLETKRAHWERLVDARDRLALIARKCAPATVPTDAEIEAAVDRLVAEVELDVELGRGLTSEEFVASKDNLLALIARLRGGAS